MIQKELGKNRQSLLFWLAKAEIAVSDGKDELARKALNHRQTHEKRVAGIEDQLNATQQAGQTCQRQIKALQVKLAEANRRLVTLIAHKRAPDLRTKVTDISSIVLPDVNAFAKFDRMQEKVEHTEAQANAMQELIRIEYHNKEEPLLNLPIETLDVEIELELASLKKKCK